jgi:purine nucleosidase
MATRRILIDTDTGVDDSLAILVALAEPRAEVIGIGSTYGNCRSDQAARNALYVLEVAGHEEIPVAQGAIPPPSTALIDSAAVVHGRDGLSGTGFQPNRLTTSDEDAVEQLLRVAEESEGQVELLTLGPLTNLAAALSRDPGVLGRFKAVVIMGGMGPRAGAEAIPASYPNYHRVGDPNVWHNSDAAQKVVNAHANITWVGMNVTGRFLVPFSLLDGLAAQGGAKARFARDIHVFYSDFVTRTYGRDEPVFTIHDTIAAAVLLDPRTAVESVDARPALAEDEDGRGGVWGEDSGPDDATHRFVVEVDRSEIEARIRETLASSAS